MTERQFSENEQRLKEKLVIANFRYEEALELWNSNDGKNYVEEHRLYLRCVSAESSKIGLEKKLLALQTANINSVATAQKNRV